MIQEKNWLHTVYTLATLAIVLFATQQMNTYLNEIPRHT